MPLEALGGVWVPWFLNVLFPSPGACSLQFQGQEQAGDRLLGGDAE